MRQQIETIVGTRKARVALVFSIGLMAMGGLGCQKKTERIVNLHPPAPEFSALSGTITTTLTSNPAASYTNSRVITFNFSSNAADAKFICQFNTQERGYCIPPVTYSNLPDGHYSFDVFAESSTMGTDRIGANHLWTVDGTPPTTQLAWTTTGYDSILFALSANENSCTFVCALDSAPSSACTSPVSYQGLARGPHSFSAQAIDRAGNIDPLGAKYNFELRPPLTTTLISATPSAQFSNQDSIVFRFTSNLSGVGFICAMNGGTAVHCSSPFTYNGLKDATYTFKVQAVDGGFVDSVGASYSWVVDTIPPLGGLVRVDTTSTSVTVFWTTNEPATSKLFWGRDVDLSQQTSEDMTYSLRHQVRITGLSSNTQYSLEPAGADRATNGYRLNAVIYRTKR